MTENIEETAPPARPEKRKQLWEYLEQNKEAILIDYQSMTILDFLKRWGICTTTWLKLKKKWEVPKKKRGAASRPVKEPAPKPAKQSIGEDTALTEHERYLILLGYQQAVREFLKSG